MKPHIPPLCRSILLIGASLTIGGPITAEEVAEVDHQLIEEIYSQTDLAESQPAPGLRTYTGHLVREALGALFSPLADRATGFAEVSIWLWMALGAGALVTAIVLLTQGLSRRRAARSEGEAAIVGVEFEQQPRYSPQEWLGRHQRALQSGDLALALEALWWWVASIVSPPGLDSSWTTRQLRQFADGEAVRSGLRRLDELAFGAETAHHSDVLALQSSFASILQSGGFLGTESSTGADPT